MKDLMDMVKQKDGGEMDMMEKAKHEAKKEILMELMGMADGSEREGIMDGLSKITVAADDKEGLMEGMEHAGDMMEQMPEDEMAPDMMGSEYEDDDEEYEG